MNYTIEAAGHRDTLALSQIAFSSKKHWGYPDDWMEMWRPDLTITPDIIKRDEAFKLTLDEEIIGFAVISASDQEFEIEHCWIRPEYIGKGLGSRLINHILALPKYKQQKFKVIADPNSVPFYEKFGFAKIDEVPSKPEGRFLPLLEMTNS